ncbi:MAG: hypothetical protein QMD44_09110 [Thermodesulfovibrionales bacterium]|nr:hypothetical protein [Thermodesulfovibrionales bacterium]
MAKGKRPNFQKNAYHLPTSLPCPSNPAKKNASPSKSLTIEGMR